MSLFRALLLVLALLAAQQGALHHDLEHAGHELGLAGLDHESEKCVAYDALGHALSSQPSFSTREVISFSQDFFHPSSAAIAARTAFASRAPPYSA